jgi:hypothetical protein
MSGQWSLLFEAVINHSLEETDADEVYDKVVALLDNHEGDANEEDEDGQSILIACCSVRMAFFSARVAELLVERGADVHATFKNKTPLQWLHFRGNSAGGGWFEKFLEDFFGPVTTMSTASSTKTVEGASSTSVTTTTTTTVTTTYHTNKKAKVDHMHEMPRLCDEWRKREKEMKARGAAAAAARVAASESSEDK